MADLARCHDLGVTAVVSLSRVGDADIASTGVQPGHHAEVWLIDSEDPNANADLGFTLVDAARTIATLRAEGHTVLVHCVRAEHRTPSVALAYSRLRGVPAREAADHITATLRSRISGLLWQTAALTPVES